jgi:MFS transporter, FSR family, fosmidomycin resistance protein
MARLSDAQNTRNVLILCSVGYFSSYFFELMFPTLAVTLASQTRLPLDEVWSWSFGGYLLFGLGAAPAGFLADRMGVRRVLVVALFALGVASLAASEAPNGRVLSLSLALMGACASVFRPVGMSLISRAIDARGRALGVMGVVGNAAIALTPIITAALCTRLGWQATYRVVGYAMCAIAIASAFLRVDEQRGAAEGLAAGWGAGAAPISRDASAHEALLPLGVLAGAAALAGVSHRGNTIVQPAYFAARVPELGFGVTTSLVYLLGIAGQYVGGRLADRYDPRRLYLAFHLLSLPALLLMAVFANAPLVACAGVFVFFSLGMQPIEDSLFAHLTPPRWRATAYGAKIAVTVGVGSLAVWLVRWAAATGGLSYALLWLAGVVLLVVGAAALLVRLGERPSRVRADAVPEGDGGHRSLGAVHASAGALASINTGAPERRPPGATRR